MFIRIKHLDTLEVGTWNPQFPPKKNRLQIPKCEKSHNPWEASKNPRPIFSGARCAAARGTPSDKANLTARPFAPAMVPPGVKVVLFGEWLGPHLQIWKPYIGYVNPTVALMSLSLLFRNHRSCLLQHISGNSDTSYFEPHLLMFQGPHIFVSFQNSEFQRGSTSRSSDIRPCWTQVPPPLKCTSLVGWALPIGQRCSRKPTTCCDGWMIPWEHRRWSCPMLLGHHLFIHRSIKKIAA